MSSRAEYFLKKALGEDFLESLQKFELWKPGTKSTLDHEEIRTALQIVPRTVMALLIRELAPMAIGDNKKIPLFVAGNAFLNVTKHERDVYSGDIEHENKKIVDFKFRALPGIGLIIMSAFELYDMDNLINSPTSAPALPQPSEDIQSKVQKMIDERLALHDLVGQVVDKKIMEKDAVHSLLLLKLTEELKKEKENAAHLAVKVQDFKQHAEEWEDIAKKAEADKKRRSPVQAFLDSRKKKNEFSIHMAKGETVDCPDCGKNIFDGQLFSGCVCLGDDMEKKVFIKKNESGITLRFSKGWDQENIEMLLEVLRRKKHE